MPSGSLNTNSRSALAERVNRESLLTSEELFDHFARVQLLLSEALRACTSASPSIAMTILEVGSEVAAKLQRNKSLFRRRVEYTVDEQLKDAAPDPLAERGQFLCDCMDLARGVIAKGDIRDGVEDTRLSRMFMERFVRAWLHQAEGYEDAVWETAESYTGELTDEYIDSASKMLRVRHRAGLPEYSYGLVRYVRDRIAAIDVIYGRITQAYARIILKTAKAHSVDDDHFLELFQYGYFGIQRANTVYDYVLNAKYVAVAKWWVRQSILYQMKASSGIIKISPSLWQHRARMEQVRQKLLAKKGSATFADIASEIDVTERYVESVYDHVRIAQVSNLEPAMYENETVEAFGDTTLHDLTDAMSRLSREERVYLGLMYQLSEIVPQNLDTDILARHRLRQRIGSRLIAEA